MLIAKEITNWQSWTLKYRCPARKKKSAKTILQENDYFFLQRSQTQIKIVNLL